MGLILFVLTLQLSPVDSLAESLDPEHATLAALESLEELTSWLVLVQEGADRVRLAVDLPGTRLALAGRGAGDREWSGYLRTTLPGSVTVTAGDLRPSFGAGMILATPRFGTPETSGISAALRKPRLTGYAGSNTAERIRGLAAVRDTRPWFAGVFTAGQTHGAALEHRLNTSAVGAMAVRTSSGRTKVESWFRSSLGPVGFEAAASGGSVIGSVKLSRGRAGPTLRLAARRFSSLSRHAAPPRLRSGLGNAEQGLTMAGRWPLGRTRITLAIDHSTDQDDVQDRARLSINSPTTDIRVDRRLRTNRLPSTPEDTGNSKEWRVQASQKLLGPPTVIFSGFVATNGGRTSSYLRARVRAERGPRWQFEASVTDFRTQQGGPVAAVYEPSPEGAFPIVRLSGEGRRLSARITRSGQRARARLACSWHSVRARDAIQGPEAAASCSFSVSG